MNSTSLPRVRNTKSLGGALWREILLLAGVAVLAAFVVALGLGAAFGPCRQRQATPSHLPALTASNR